MPLYNHIPDWNGLEIEVHPLETWRRRIPFWPYFVGQKVRLEVIITKKAVIDKVDLQFHVVEKMAGENKPKIVSLILKSNPTSVREKVFSFEEGSLITGRGEIRYWLSNRGYNVDHEPVFAAEAINPDSFIVPFILMVVGPILGFLGGLILGLVIGG